jgi:ribosomal protein S12 methylthiotransferase accessory factor
LRIGWSADHLWIGPLVEPGQDGCFQCFTLWTMNDWSRDAAARAADHPALTACWSQPFRVAAAAAVAEAASTGMSGSTALFLSSDFRDWSRHSFFRHPQCDRCTPLPDDTAEAARALAEPGAEPPAGSFRTHNLPELERIVAVGVDRRCGLVRSIRHDTPSMIFPMAHAVLAPERRPTSFEVGVGRTGSRRKDAVVAVLEGIERFAGLRARGGRRSSRAPIRSWEPRPSIRATSSSMSRAARPSRASAWRRIAPPPATAGSGAIRSAAPPPCWFPNSLPITARPRARPWGDAS